MATEHIYFTITLPILFIEIISLIVILQIFTKLFNID